MKTEQTVLIINVREDGSARGDHLSAKLCSMLSHPQYQGVVTYTVEKFPQAPPVPLEEEQR